MAGAFESLATRDASKSRACQRRTLIQGVTESSSIAEVMLKAISGLYVQWEGESVHAIIINNECTLLRADFTSSVALSDVLFA